MDYNPSLEDTQPKAPLSGSLPAQDQPPDEPRVESRVSGAPGCFAWGCIGLIGLGLALAIVLLAGAAGWTSGRRAAEINATATQNAEIGEQINRIPSDLSSGNLQLADLRIRFLATMTPGVPGVPEFIGTATAVYLTSQPSPTPTVTETPAVEATEEADALVITPSGDNGGYDLAALLQEAETSVGSGQYADGYELLNVISGVDSDYEAARVRQLTAQALNGQARMLFNANKPAEAIYWASLAEELGVLEGDLSFELFAAQNYLDAKAALGLSPAQAINALYQIYNLGPGRYYEEARQLLVDQYIAYGDALALDSGQGYCPAAAQYQNAVNIFNDSTAIAKRDNANAMCAQATPTFAPGFTPPAPGTPGQPPASGQIAPVGQPGT